MRQPFAFAALAFAATTGLARAEAPSPPAPTQERFTMIPAEGGGFVRLNKETGAVSHCSVTEGVTVCRLGAEERMALESEIDRLRKENAALKARAEGAPPPSARPNGGPSEEEFERALSFTERFLRRIMRVLREEAPNGGSL